jgi:hypothetical protein
MVLFQNCVWWSHPLTKMADNNSNCTVVAILVGERDCQTQIWKRTIQWLFRQSLVLIELLVPDEMVFMFLSETICSIRTKCWWNSHWMVLFQKYIRWFGPSTKMAPIGSYVKLSTAVQPSWSEGGTTRHNFGRGPSIDYFIKVWFQLGGPLPKLCPAFHTSDQDDCYSRT